MDSRFIIKVILFNIVLFTVVLQATSVDELLHEFTKKNDLSTKTIDANKGHLVLYTRERLEKMHAHTLKDVFKTTPVVYYNENRYALPDSLSSGLFEPYKSNFIRLYVDGIEVTQGWLGSGLALYGDINIHFVDHIEFYYLTPSFESSTEPAYLTIFLYSKSVEQDSGGALSLLGGSRGHNVQSFNYGSKNEDYSYMVNVSHTDAKREKISNGTQTPLSRDFERTQLFSYIKGENQTFHLQLMQKKTDALGGLSLDATPLKSKIDYLNLHMDYSIDFSENWRAEFSYEWLKSDMEQADNTSLFFAGLNLGNSFRKTSKSHTYSGNLIYKTNINQHRITTGLKGRIKELDKNSFESVNIPNFDFSFNKETILTAYFQDQYALSDTELLTLGLSYNKILRNGVAQDDDLFQMRLGYIAASDAWTYKTYLSRTMFALDPASRLVQSKNIKVQKTLSITEEVSYVSADYQLRLMMLLMKDEDGILENAGDGNTKYFFSVLNYDYDYDINNKINLQLYYARYDDIFNLDKLEDWSGYISLSNTYESIEFFNAVIWHQNSIDYKHYFDVTSTVSWNISEKLSMTLKGENLFNRAKETNLFRIDPMTGNLLNPLSISPIDRRITIEMEYRF